MDNRALQAHFDSQRGQIVLSREELRQMEREATTGKFDHPGLHENEAAYRSALILLLINLVTKANGYE